MALNDRMYPARAYKLGHWEAGQVAIALQLRMEAVTDSTTKEYLRDLQDMFNQGMVTVVVELPERDMGDREVAEAQLAEHQEDVKPADRKVLKEIRELLNPMGQ